ncbi:MAG: choice-of-anchor Q domain-containing protein [Pseudomonadota bacterium]
MTRIAFFALLCATMQTSSAQFSIDTTADTGDADPGNGICADSDGNCSLRAAIQEANALAGADEIVLPPGTFRLALEGDDDSAGAGDLDVFDELEIIGSGAGQTVLGQDAAGERIFDVFNQPTQAVALTLRDLTIRDGDVAGNGGAIRNQGLVSAVRVHFLANAATGDGGAIQNNVGGDVTLDSCYFEGNVAASDGAGGSGGAINNNAGAIAKGDGGDVIAGTGTVTTRNSDFLMNRASAGGAINSSRNNRIFVEGGLFTQNSAAPFDGGVANLNSSNALMRVEGARMSSNTAERNGGAINNNSGSVLEVFRSEISDNMAGRDGGGLNSNSSRDSYLLVASSAVTGNSAGRDGGGVHTFGDSRVDNSTLSQNTAVRNGGGFKAGGVANVLSSSTVTGNSAGDDGGGVYAAACDVVGLKNNAIAENGGGDCGFRESNQASAPEIFVSLGHNLDGDDTCQLTQLTDLPATDPLLDPLAANGAPGLSRLPQMGSPLLDAGDATLCPARDQRSVTRGGAAGPCDIGSIERADDPTQVFADSFERPVAAMPVEITAPGQTQACIND